MAAGRPITGINISTGAAYSALAFGDGSADDTSVIQAALTACGLIYIPAGIYKVTSTLTFPASTSSVGIIGAGACDPAWTPHTGTMIYFTPTTGDIVRFNASTYHPTLIGLGLCRPTVASSGYGVSIDVSNDAMYLADLVITKSRTGIKAGVTGYSSISNVRIELCGSHAFDLTGQYQLSKCLAALNGGDAIHCVGRAGGSSQGQWTGISSFNNGGNGMSFLGVAGAEVFGIRLSDSFVGNDAGYGYYVDTAGGTQPNNFTGIYSEEGSAPSMYLAANCGWNTISASTFGGGSPCLYSAAPVTMISCCNFTYGAGYGVLFTAGSGSVIGCSFFNNAGPAIGAGIGVNGFTAVGNCISQNIGPGLDISVASNTYAAGNY